MRLRARGSAAPTLTATNATTGATTSSTTSSTTSAGGGGRTLIDNGPMRVVDIDGDRTIDFQFVSGVRGGLRALRKYRWTTPVRVLRCGRRLSRLIGGACRLRVMTMTLMTTTTTSTTSPVHSYRCDVVLMRTHDIHCLGAIVNNQFATYVGILGRIEVG
jgi:hypothetical protein